MGVVMAAPIQFGFLHPVCRCYNPVVKSQMVMGLFDEMQQTSSHFLLCIC